jgi:hypothetical protein
MGLLSSEASFISSILGQGIISESLDNAISEMQDMCANEGQSAAVEIIIPDFEDAAQASVEEGWQDVDCSPYCDFIGEIIEAGNQIMSEAYAIAADLAAQGGDGEEYDEDTGEPIEE